MKKCFVRRGARRVEMIREHSKTAISVMWCGSASSAMIPPMVVYKAQHVYEGWTMGGPRGTVYDCTPSGWFDGRTFTRWFLLAFLPAAERQECAVGRQPGVALYVRGDQSSAAERVFLRSTSDTHLMQPLGRLCVRADEASVAEHPDGVAHRDEEEGVLPEGDLSHSHAAPDCRHRTDSNGQTEVWLQDKWAPCSQQGGVEEAAVRSGEPREGELVS